MAAKKKSVSGGKTPGGNTPPVVNKRYAELVNNALMTRQSLLSSLIDPNRDIDEECGYPRELSTANYRSLYDREGIASRVVSVMPEECWQKSPSVLEDSTPQETPFEQAIADLSETHNLWAYLERVDELSGIGRFGVLLLGFDDGLDLHVEVPAKVEGSNTAPRKLLYVRPFDEASVTITKTNTDSQSPRHGLPELYNITLLDIAAGDSATVQKRTLHVHWSRVVHVADNRKTSEVYGTPRMQDVFNRLYDLRKLLGGSAEMFWKGAYPGYSFEVNPELGDVELDTDAMKVEFEKYSNGLQRFLAIQGVSAKSLAPQVANPGPHFEVLLKAIAVSKGIPWRILLGTEEGQLAGAQDQVNWNRRLAKRQANYLTPWLVRPLVDRLIGAGVLEPPADGRYEVQWPDLNTVSEIERAQVATEKVKAYSAYVTSGVDTLVPPLEFLTKVMGMDEEEAGAVLQAALDAVGSDPLAGPEPDTQDDIIEPDVDA